MKKIYLLFLLVFSFFMSCSSDNDIPEPTPEPPKVTEPVILSFIVKEGSTKYEGEIDTENKKISVSVPSNTNLRSLEVEVSYTEGATLSPESGYSYNFSNPLEFSLSMNGITVTYEVKVSSQPEILSFEIPAYDIVGVVSDGLIEIEVKYGIDITNLAPVLQLSAGCTVTPASGATVDLSKDVVYTVKNKFDISREYAVKVTILPQEKMVRGVWVPDPSHTSVLLNYTNLREFIDLLDELHINTIYLATWVREKTLYKSQVLLQNTNYNSIEEGWLLNGASYNGLTNDPIKDLLTLAHEKDIKVFFWFEYGFMRSGGSNPPATHPILSIHPEWDGISSNGGCSNYNGTDYYLNSYDEEVQEFMLQLMEESIDLYPEVDGIQGDDRLPAAPRNSGYNEKTVQKYELETGKRVSANHEDSDWVRWRLANLNNFGKTMYQRLKAKKNGIIVASSPNPYPWCVNNLMQDWPTWIKDGYVDLLSVQCYRETASSYYTTLNEANNYVTSNTNKYIFNPGIYLRTSSDWEEIFTKQMEYNREFNTNGEAFFYNEGLKREVNKRVLKKFYTGKALFPFD